MTAITESHRKTKRRLLLNSRGVDTAPQANWRLRERLQKFYDRGFSTAAMAATAGISATTVQNILNHRHSKTRFESFGRLKTMTHEDIFLSPPNGSFVGSYATKRRIEALMCLGWRRADIDPLLEKLGCKKYSSQVFYRTEERIDVFNHRAMAQVYETLAYIEGPSEQTKKSSQTKGWAPPMAWDNIDDFYEKPKGVL